MQPDKKPSYGPQCRSRSRTLSPLSAKFAAAKNSAPEPPGDAVEVTVVAAGFGPRPNRRIKSDSEINDNGGDGLPDFIKG